MSSCHRHLQMHMWLHAQIFGDLFQLLDRNKDGYSEYPIKADHDLKDYLLNHLPEDSEGIRDGKLCLPPNLSIICPLTMKMMNLEYSR